MDYKKPQSTLVQGGAGIYPLTTADQVILADGSRLEKDGKINADSASDSAKLGGKAPEYYIQPRNLLDNSDFRNPVNQRVYTVYNTLGYTIDRWLLYFSDWANFTVGDGLVFNASSNGCSFYQRIVVNAVKVGAKYTLAYMLDGDVYAQEQIFEATENKSYDVAIIIPEGTHTLLWAALYEGSYTIDTLPPYVPKGYAAELAECDLYYRPLGDNAMSIIGMTSSDGGVVILKSIRPMRDGSVPTIINNGTLYARVNGTDYTLTDVRILKSGKSGVEMLANASGAPSKQTATIHGSALLALSMDL